MTDLAVATPLPRDRVWLMRAALVVAVVTLVRVLALWVVSLDLSGDEAQYWLWAKQPDLGYYSKPPLLAWAIALTTALGGDSEPWVRLSAPLFHAGTAMALYAIGGRLFGPRAGFWSAVLFVTLPAVWLGSLLVSTDTPLLCFYALALAAFVYALQARDGARSGPWWLLLGLALGLGLLSKYAALYLLIGLGLALVLVPAWRRRVAPLPALGALLLAAAVLAPNLWWNWATGFVTVSHTADNANLGGATLGGSLVHPSEMARFLGAQLAVFGPLAFPLLVGAIGLAVAGRTGVAGAGADLRALALVALPPLAAMTLLALLSRANANWAVTAYVPGCALLAGWLLGRGRERWLRAAVAANAALGLGGLVLAAALAQGVVSLPPGIRAMDAVSGWERLGREVRGVLDRHPAAVLASDDRMLFTELSYYARVPAGRGYAFDSNGRIDNHFELTTPLTPSVAGDVLVATLDPDPRHILAAFERMEPLGVVEIALPSGRTRRVGLYLGSGFRGRDGTAGPVSHRPETWAMAGDGRSGTEAAR